MKYTDALRWTLLNRAIAIGAFLAGVVLFALGMVAGFGEAVTLFFSNFPNNVGEATDRANPMVTLVFAIVGILVWQVGKTFALYVTLPRATARRTGKSIDSARLRSELLEGLDARLATMEEDVVETRRSVQELKREVHATSFDEGELTGPTGSRSDGGAPGGNQQSSGRSAEAENVEPGAREGTSPANRESRTEFDADSSERGN